MRAFKNVVAFALFAAFLIGLRDDNAWICGGALIVLVLLPPGFDPAVRIKEWQIRRGVERR